MSLPTEALLLNDSLIEVVDKKMIEPEEAYMKAVDKASIEIMLKARNMKLELKE